MEKLEFTLKQHTPLIHFQHDQEGATLRATELKPKLDVFIRHNIDGFNDYKKFLLLYKKEDDKKYGIHYKDKIRHFAFNYKVKVRPGNRINLSLKSEPKDGKYKTQAFPFMLSNMGGKDTESELLNFSLYDEVKITFSSIHKELLGEIEDFFPYMLAAYNFGNRQNKGFGCFYLKNSTKADFEEKLKEINPNSTIFRKKINLQVSKSLDYYTRLFRSIENDYKRLKSGIGQDESELKVYFEDQGILWEKKALKETIKNQHINIADYRYIRILLGLAEHFEYPQLGLKIKIKNADNNENEIQRFKSPITFKFFENNAYLIPEAISKNDDIFGKTFSFIFESEKEPGLNGKIIELKSPSKDDIEDTFPESFIRQVIDKFGWIEI